MKSILDGVTLGMAHWAKVHNLAIVEGNLHFEQKVHLAAGCPFGGNACYQLCWYPKRGPCAEHSVGLAIGTEADRFERTSGRTHLQQRKKPYPM